MSNFTRKPPTTDFRAKPDEEYNPPLGSSIGANFTNVPPTTDFNRGGEEPKGDAQYVTGEGFLSSTVNDPQLVWNWQQHTLPESIVPTLSYGDTLIYNSDTYALPSGIAAPSVPTAHLIYNNSQFTYPEGFSSFTIVDTHEVVNTTADQVIYHPTLGHNTVIGTAHIGNRVATQGDVHTEYGALRLVKYDINVEFTDFGSFGSASVYRTVNPIGFTFERVSPNATVTNWTNYIEPVGRDYLTIGLNAEVIDANQYISNAALGRQLEFGDDTTVFNRIDYVEIGGQEYLVLPTNHTVENRNQTVQLGSHDSLTFGESMIDYSKHDVAMKGVAHTQYGDTNVWYKIRQVDFWSFSIDHATYGTTDFYLVEPSDETVTTVGETHTEYGGQTVENTSDSFTPDGEEFTEMGEPTVLNLTQRTRTISDEPMTEYGDTLIYNSDTYALPDGERWTEYGTPWVSNWINYVTPQGFDSAEYGSTRTVNTTGNRNVVFYGYTSNGREIHYGIDSFEDGMPEVNLPTTVTTPESIEPTLTFGVTDIELLHRKVAPPSIASKLVIGKDHRVELLHRTVFVQGEHYGRYGNNGAIFDPLQEVTNVGITNNVDNLMGRNHSIYNYHQFIDPTGIYRFASTQWHTVSNRNRTVRLLQPEPMTEIGRRGSIRNVAYGIFAEGEGYSQYGDTTVWRSVRNVSFFSFGSTHTLYGDDGSVVNHADLVKMDGGRAFTEISRPTIFNRNIDVLPEGKSPAELYGQHTVENQAEALYPLGQVWTQYGTARLLNSDLHITLTNEGVKPPDIGTDGWVSNWVRTLTGRGYLSQLYGQTTVINTTADQTISKVTTDPTLTFGRAQFTNTEAYRVNVRGDELTLYGQLRFVPYNINVDFTPPTLTFGTHSVHRRFTVGGYYRDGFGERTNVELSERTVVPASIGGVSFGNNIKIFDPTQEVTRVGISNVGLIGSRTEVYNLRSYVHTFGRDTFSSLQWHRFDNRSRHVTTRSNPFTQYGSPRIRNLAFGINVGSIDFLRTDRSTVTHSVRTVNLWSFGITIPPMTHNVASLRNANRQVTVRSISAPSLPSPRVDLSRRTLAPRAVDYLDWGKPFVDWGRRYVMDVGGTTFSLYNSSHNITHELRDIETRGGSYLATGHPSIALTRHYVDVAGLNSHVYGRPTMVMLRQYIYARGERYTGYGRSIRPQWSTVWLRGIRPPTMSPHAFSNANRSVTMRALSDNTRYGIFTDLTNLRQYVDFSIDRNGLPPPSMERSVRSVVSTTRTITMRSVSDTLRFGYNRIVLSGRAALMEGDVHSEIVGASLVANHTRDVAAGGIPVPVIMRYTAVHNNAVVVVTEGDAHDNYGNARVISRTQYVRGQHFNSAEYGKPWVSESPRRLRVFSFSSFFSPKPTVEHYAREVLMRSVRQTSEVSHKSEVTERRLIIRFTSGIVATEYGRRHDLFNVTPELTKVGDAHSIEWGRPTVRLEWRPLAQRGEDLLRVAEPRVMFTLGLVLPRGNDTFVTGRPSVANTDKDPIIPSRQSAAVDGFLASGHLVERDRYGRHVVFNNSATQLSVGNTFTAGSAHVTQTVQRIKFNSGINIPQASSAGTVTSSIRTIAPTGMDYTITVTDGGRSTGLRVSPHRIYCTNDKPSQTDESYKYIRAEPDGWLNPAQYPHPRAERDKVGFGWDVRVQHAVAPEQPMPSKLTVGHTFESDPFRVVNSGGEIKLTGLSSWRIGWVTMLPHDINVNFYDSEVHTAYGQSTIKHSDRPFAQTIAPRSMTSAGIGEYWVSRYHRIIEAGNNVFTTYGRPADRNSYAWNGFAVSPPRPTKPSGIASTVKYGEHWVSRSPRPLEVEGLLTFRSEYTISQFEKRMRVQEVNRPDLYPTQHISPSSIVSEQVVTVPDIQLMRYYIRPDGWVDMYIKGINGVSHG